MGCRLILERAEPVMATNRDGLMRKFAALRNRSEMAPKRSVARRTDFKGARGRLNLRLPEDVLEDLQIVKTASGVDKNAFCEGILVKAIRDRIGKLKGVYDAAGWAIVTQCAKRSR
jgi:hypothetical protein